MRKTTLLLLSGGGHTGYNVLNTLADRRAGLRIVACGDSADEPTLFCCDAIYLAPTLAEDGPGFEHRFLDILAWERPDLVIPCRDEDVAWLAGFGRRHPEHAPRLLCGSPEVAEMARDKWLSHEFSRQHGLPFAPTLACGPIENGPERLDAFLGEHGLPLVLKPRRGAEGRGISLITGRHQAIRALNSNDCVLQRFLGPRDAVDRYLDTAAREGVPLFHSFEGVKHSLQLLIGPTGSVAGLCCTRHALTGRNARTVSIDEHPEAPAIARDCAEVLVARGWRGPMNIQCQEDETGRLVIHEFNARYTGATAARRLLGHDELGLTLSVFLGWPDADRPPERTTGPVREGLAPRAIDRSMSDDLARHGVWRRDPD